MLINVNFMKKKIMDVVDNSHDNNSNSNLVFNTKFELGKKYKYSVKMAQAYQDAGHFIFVRKECEGIPIEVETMNWNESFSEVVGHIDGVLINPQECVEVK